MANSFAVSGIVIVKLGVGATIQPAAPHGFIIHWIIISKNSKKVTEVIDVKNWRVDNSRVLWWIISLIVWNSSVSSTKSSIQRKHTESDKGVKVSSPSRANQNMTTPLSNSFDVLNMVEKEDVQNPKVSDHAGTSSLNLHVNKDQEGSLWSRFNKRKENAKSKSSKLKDESDDDEVYMPHGGGFTDGMEDDLECYDGYGTLIVPDSHRKYI
ncbi:hypothetical protein Tco_1528136 [Tanacetum coccineum]